MTEERVVTHIELLGKRYAIDKLAPDGLLALQHAIRQVESQVARKGAYAEWTVEKLVDKLLDEQDIPDYRVLLVPEDFLFPSPWCERFRIEIDDERHVVRLLGDFT